MLSSETIVIEADEVAQVLAGYIGDSVAVDVETVAELLLPAVSAVTVTLPIEPVTLLDRPGQMRSHCAFEESA